MDGLSRLIKKAQSEGMIKGLKISKDLSITHGLFVDDVLLARTDSVEEWKAYQNIINIFCKASGMKVNLHKSCLYENLIGNDMIRVIQLVMPYNCCKLFDGFTYLGFHLKPNRYLINDCHWLIKKFEARIYHWTFRLLSVGGKLTLLKSVLMGTPVY